MSQTRFAAPARLPYGSWPSSLSPDDLARSSLRLAPGILDAGRRYWSEGHPEQGGRVGLWCSEADGPAVELTPEATVRTSVNEYGGGEWTAADGLVAWCNGADDSVRLLEPGAAERVIAAGPGLRFAGLRLEPRFRLLLAVREDHRGEGEPQQAIVAIDLDRTEAQAGRILVSGDDFYAHPSLSVDAQLAWCSWNHPDMPWDKAGIFVAPLADPASRTVVELAERTSALYPSWAPDGALIYLSDAGGYWNFRRWSQGAGTTLWRAPFDFCGPLWTLAPVPYSIIDAAHIGCSWIEDGFARLGVLAFPTAETTLTRIPTAAVTAEITGTGPRSLILLGYADRPSELVEWDWDDGRCTILRAGSTVRLDPEQVSVAEPVSWASPDGPVHGWFYPPKNQNLAGLTAELPPVQVWSHGGPTAFSAPSFNPAVQFWTSRGIGILDVNYSGSTGYGRAYRERLNGRWGISDVRDCVAGAQALVEDGRADPARLSIRGSSAGGFTTLAALTSSNAFAAGISLYGIGDLESLVGDNHKFEAHYLDGLLGPYPQARDLYRARSPIHHLDRLACPMLILQGENDPVVPPSQAASMAAAVQAKGLPVRLRMFAGEGHGFRRAETIVAVAEESLAFLAAVHAFTPAAF